MLLGSKNVEVNVKNEDLTNKKSSCETVSVETPVNPTVYCEEEIVLHSCFELRQDDKIAI